MILIPLLLFMSTAITLAEDTPAQLLFKKGMRYLNEKNEEQARYYLEAAIAADPAHDAAYFNLGTICAQHYHLDEALNCFNRVIDLNPNNLTAFYNKAYVLKSMGRMTEAIPLYEQILSIQPHHENARYGSSQALLTIGDFEKGLPNFEWRLSQVKKWGQKKENLKKFAGKRILLLDEFGLGDKIQFIRYAKKLKDLGSYVIVQIDQALVPLFSLCDYIDEILVRGIPISLKADFHIPLLSLPLIFGTTVETIPADIPYIYADERLIFYWKQKLAANKNYKIGICWHGKPPENNPLTKRSIPLPLFEPLTHIPGISLYSLQQVYGLEELTQLPEDFSIHVFENIDTDHGRFMDTAALVKNLDLVVTVDTSIAHLAGALGVPVWVLVPSVAEWRWMQDRLDSPWYPTTMKLFRQKFCGDWKTPINEIVDALKQILKK